MSASHRQCSTISLLGGMALGAGLMYLLDSGRGAKVRSLRSSPPTSLPVVPRKVLPDWVLAERARLEVWKTLAHPDSVEISAWYGRVTLWGPVLPGEPERLQEKLSQLPGLRQLELQLTTREDSAARVA